MSFAAPLALLWGLLAVPVVVFYILKTRPRRVMVPTLIFWEQIFQEKRPRMLWQKMRHLLSLLAQLVLVGLLVLALGEPLLPWQSFQPRKTVLILDNSASMNATDIAPMRLEEARRQAARIVGRMRFFDTMAIIEAGTDARVACGLTDHRRTLLDTIRQIRPTDGPTRVAQAVELANRLLADEEDARIVILSDAAFDGAAELMNDERVRFLRIGGEASNVGITVFQVRRSLVDPLGCEILAEVRNFSTEPVECRLEMYLNDEVFDVVPLRLDPGGVWSQVFSKASAEGGILTATLDHRDALAADNTAWAVLPKREPVPVTLVTDGNVFLQKVFEAIPLIKLRVTHTPPPAAGPGELIVYHRHVPPTLPAGNVLVIDPTGPSDLWEIAEPIAHPLVTDQDKASPLLAHVRLDNIYMPEARRLHPAEGIDVLVTALGGEPIYMAFDRPKGRTLVLTVNLDRGDLPLRTAFPIMMTNAMNWFQGVGGEIRPSARTGAMLTLTLPRTLEPAADTALLVAPDGRERPIPITAGQVTIGPLDRVGLWTIRHGEESLDVPCNLANAAESNPHPAADLPQDTAPLAGSLGGKPLWFYLLAAACALMALEWWLYQRRWIS